MKNSLFYKKMPDIWKLKKQGRICACFQTENALNKQKKGQNISKNTVEACKVKKKCKQKLLCATKSLFLVSHILKENFNSILPTGNATFFLNNYDRE